MRVAVLGAGGPAGFNVVKALASHSYEVVAVDSVREHLVWPAQWAAETVHMPEMAVSAVNELDCDAVWPQPDALVAWTARNQREIDAISLCPPLRTLEICHSKRRAVTRWVADDLREHFPLLFGPETPDFLHLAKDRFGLPFWLRADTGAGARGACLVDDLRTGFHWIRYWNLREPGIHWVAEDYLPGRDYSWAGLYKHGRLVTSFARERLEYIYPHLSPSGLTGTPTIARIVHDDRVNEVAEAAVDTVDDLPDGIFCVDLREDEYGRPRPTEINVRFCTTVALWAPWMADLAVRIATGRTAPPAVRRNALPHGQTLSRHIDCGMVMSHQPDAVAA